MYKLILNDGSPYFLRCFICRKPKCPVPAFVKPTIAQIFGAASLAYTFDLTFSDITVGLSAEMGASVGYTKTSEFSFG
jgi:hypothetical protein